MINCSIFATHRLKETHRDRSCMQPIARLCLQGCCTSPPVRIPRKRRRMMNKSRSRVSKADLRNSLRALPPAQWRRADPVATEHRFSTGIFPLSRPGSRTVLPHHSFLNATGSLTSRYRPLPSAPLLLTAGDAPLLEWAPHSELQLADGQRN